MDENTLIYNALDGACTYEVWQSFWSDMVAQGYDRTYELTILPLEALMFMQTKGILVETGGLEKTSQKVRALEAEKREELNRLIGREINPLSPQQVAAYFYIEKRLPPYLDRKTRKPTTDDLALQRLSRATSSRPGFAEAKLIQDIRGLNKLASTYLDVEIDADGRLRSAYNPRGTRFGRQSSNETIYETGLNMQNLPPQFKEFLIPDPGYFFLEVDKRQAEWVVVAYLSGDANMMDVIENGRDPHTHTASLMFQVSDDIIKLDHKLVGSLTDPDLIAERRLRSEVAGPFTMRLPRTMSGRQAGKKSNHGLNYDEGYETFSLTNEIEQSEGKRMVEMYHRIYPNIRNFWYERVRSELARGRTLTNCFGRKYHFMQDWNDKLFKAAYSFQPQSSVVDSLNIGMTECYNDPDICGTRGANADLLAQVHDSLLFQFPLSVLDVAGAFHKSVAQIYDYISPKLEYNGRQFRIATDMKIGRNWGAYYKDTNPLGMQEVELTADAEKFENKIREILDVESGGRLA